MGADNFLEVTIWACLQRYKRPLHARKKKCLILDQPCDIVSVSLAGCYSGLTGRLTDIFASHNNLLHFRHTHTRKITK